jgi:hypothetical protein
METDDPTTYPTTDDETTDGETPGRLSSETD